MIVNTPPESLLSARLRAQEIYRIVNGFSWASETNPCGVLGAQINNELCLILSMLEDGRSVRESDYHGTDQWESIDSDYQKAIEAVGNIKMLADALGGEHE